MKAVAATAPGRVEVVEIPRPTIREYECLVRVRACGFCSSTDLKIIHGELSDMTVDFPAVIGHEAVGEVVEVGEAVRNVRAGDAFTNPAGRVEPGTPYSRMWAGMAEYAVVQDHEVMDELGVDPSGYTARAARRVPGDMPAEDAAVLLTLKEGYSALENFGFEPGMDVLVWGDGVAGRGLVTFLRMRGAGWVGCIGHHDDRLGEVRRVGGADATINSNGRDPAEALEERRFDLVIDAVGSTHIILSASQMLKPGGKVGVYGVLKKGHAEISLLDLKNNSCVHMLNFPHREHDAHEAVLAMVEEGRLDPKDFYSHALPIDDVQKAVELIESRRALKVVLTM
ncbi:MAG: zinc-dependent alcohol dehydrogenase [Planctomycetota bacterium]